MARLTGPTQAERVFLRTSGAKKGLPVDTGTPVPLYSDTQCSLPADVLGLSGESLVGSGGIPQVAIGDTLECALFQFPDVPDPVVYTRVLGGPVVALHPSDDGRMDSLAARLTAVEAGGAGDVLVAHLAGAETFTGTKTFTSPPTVPTPTANGHTATKAYVDGAVDDLSGVTNPSAARTQLGLGSAATKAVGTTSADVAAGDAPAAAITTAVGAAAGLAIVFGGL